jgi:hypothetical protein
MLLPLEFKHSVVAVVVVVLIVIVVKTVPVVVALEALIQTTIVLGLREVQ